MEADGLDSPKLSPAPSLDDFRHEPGELALRFKGATYCGVELKMDGEGVVTRVNRNLHTLQAPTGSVAQQYHEIFVAYYILVSKGHLMPWQIVRRYSSLEGQVSQLKDAGLGDRKGGPKFPGKTVFVEANAWTRSSGFEKYFQNIIKHNPGLHTHRPFLEFLIESDVSTSTGLHDSSGHASTREALNLKTSTNVGVLAAAVAEESAHAHRTTQGLGEVYENQRYQPSLGFGSSGHLLPFDRGCWSDRTGHHHSNKPPWGDLKPEEAMWKVDKTEGDKNGWLYSTNFGKLSSTGGSPAKGLTDFVRRRRWVPVDEEEGVVVVETRDSSLLSMEGVGTALPDGGGGGDSTGTADAGVGAEPPLPPGTSPMDLLRK